MRRHFPLVGENEFWLLKEGVLHEVMQLIFGYLFVFLVVQVIPHRFLDASLQVLEFI
jgi:hypothetical protein